MQQARWLGPVTQWWALRQPWGPFAPQAEPARWFQAQAPVLPHGTPSGGSASDLFTGEQWFLANVSPDDPTRSRDGIHCAGQLCAILLQVDSTRRGREWLAGLDTFAPSSKNLVWRMACLNNAAIQAHVRWRGARRMTHDDLRNPTLRMIRQSDIECVALVLYWPPFDAGDPERKGEDILWVCPDVVTGEFYWQYIRTFMEDGMDAVPFPGEKDWLRKGFSSPGELMREQASSSTLVNVLDFIWWPVQSLAERLCYWPTFPEEWNSDCGRRRRESGIGPEEPLRWQARDLDGTEKETPRSGRQPVADGEGDGDGDNRTGEAVENRASPGVLQACRSDGASQETQTRSASGPCHASAALPVLPIVDSQSAAEPLRTAADTASSVELVTTFVDLFVD